MNFYRRNILILLAVAVTALALGGLKLLPEKRLTLHPQPAHTLALYADENWGGKSSAHWRDEQAAHWHCDLAQSSVYPVCGMAVVFESQTIDFSRFETLNLQLSYTGEASKLRIYIRNHNPAYSDIEDTDSLKFNSVTLRTADLASDQTVVHLSEFSVAEWWLDEHSIARELALPEMDQVTTLGFDLPYPQVFGPHDLQLDHLELVGPRVVEKNVYLGLLAAWLTALTYTAARSLLWGSRRNGKGAT